MEAWGCDGTRGHVAEAWEAARTATAGVAGVRAEAGGGDPFVVVLLKQRMAPAARDGT